MATVGGRTQVEVRSGDISPLLKEAIEEAHVAAVDIETSGLDWRSDSIASIQVAIPGGNVEVVRISSDSPRPGLLSAVLEDGNVLKVFHHAMFDLRFMCSAWSIAVVHVACTKIAAKLLRENGASTSLADLTKHYLGVDLDKSEQVSDWHADSLSLSQIQYAANDVRYLHSLLHSLLRELEISERDDLVRRCFDFIPTQVELDLLECDVFRY